MANDGEKGVVREAIDYWRNAFRNAGESTKEFVRNTVDGLNRLVNGPKEP